MRGPGVKTEGALQIPADVREQLREQGYVILKGVFTSGELRSLRASCEAFFRRQKHMRSHLGRNMPDATRHVPAIHWLYSHPSVLAAFRAALGTEDILFTRHCDVAKNRLSDWHKDSGEVEPYFSGDYFAAPDCRVYKMAVYLQPHRDGRGLWVRPGSHWTPDKESGEAVHLDTEAGDAIVFDVRLTHSGAFGGRVEGLLGSYGRRVLRSPHPKHDHELLVRLKDAYWRIRRRPDKFSIFFTYGSPNDFTREFSERNMERQRAQLEQFDFHGSLVSDERLIQTLLAEGVKVFGAD
jgi:phytanoyl-CoA dioxygenase PhyH